MAINNKALENIQDLVGNIKEENLKYVDCYVSKHLGVFIPSVGFCEYAIRPEHTHPSFSFVLFFSEKQSIVPVTMEVLPNNYLGTVISPEVVHEEKETDDFTRYIAIFISSEFYENHYTKYSDKKPERYIWNQFITNQDIMINIKKFMSEYENKLPGYEDVLDSLSTIITHQLIRSVLNIDDSSELFVEKFEIEKAIEYMHQNFGEKLTLESLANYVNMSESNFIRTFKKETKLAPIEYLINLRIEKAKKLLRSKGKTITQIALQCGFNSASHFSTCFSKQLGSTPTQYQNIY